MARSDLLIGLARAGSSGNRELFRKTLQALIAEERAKQHHILADRLEQSIIDKDSTSNQKTDMYDEQSRGLFYELTPRRTLDDLILTDTVLNPTRELIEEHHRSDLLRSYNLEPRHRVLLVGEPGNGKTSLAEALADALMVPLIGVRYEGIIGSYLGETANRLNRLFDFARSRRCVLFLDEFDTLAKERGDTHETGEIKRVVSSLLLQMDDLPSHVVIVTATNHPELLDRAVWRRFQLRLELPSPSVQQLEKWFETFRGRFSEPIGYSPKTLAQKFLGLSFSEVEEFSTDVMRRYVLELPNTNIKKIISRELKIWGTRVTPSPSSQG